MKQVIQMANGSRITFEDVIDEDKVVAGLEVNCVWLEGDYANDDWVFWFTSRAEVEPAQSNPRRIKRVWDFHSDGYGVIITYLEDTVDIRRPKDARCRYH